MAVDEGDFQTMVHHEINFPEGWDLKQIKDIAPLQRGFDLPASKVVSGKYPVCYSNGIANYHNEYKAEGPGVFTGRSGTIGNVFYVDGNFWPHNTSLWVTDFKGNDRKFVYYLYQQVKLERFNAGTGVPTLNRNDVHVHKVPIPLNVEEQQKISSILSTWDKAIELKEKLIEQKKEQKKGLMQKLLTSEVRLPGFDGEWGEYEVQEICSLGRGRVISKKEIAKNIGTYPVYSSQTSDEGKIGSINTYDFDGEYITWTTDGANAGTVFYRNGKFNCTNVCGILKLNKDNIDARYLSYILQANTDKYVVRHGNPKLMNNIMAIIPVRIFNNYNYQKYICDLFDVLDKEIKFFEKEVKEIKHQKQGLMQQLLTGKKRVKV